MKLQPHTACCGSEATPRALQAEGRSEWQLLAPLRRPGTVCRQSSDGGFPEEGTNTQCHLTWCCSVAQLCPTLCDLVGCSPSDSPGKNSEVGCHALLQGIFQTQGLNPALPHYKWILYDLSHQGSPHLTYLHPNIDGEVGRHKRPMGMKAWSCEKPEA